MEEVRIEGWKGKGKLSIEEYMGGFKVIEARKSKESGEYYTMEKVIDAASVAALWNLIKSNFVPNVTYGYKYLVRMVIDYYGLAKKEKASEDMLVEAFNGGKFRSKYYFPLLYYPLKILESKGVITYLGRGGVIKNGQTIE